MHMDSPEISSLSEIFFGDCYVCEHNKGSDVYPQKMGSLVRAVMLEKTSCFYQITTQFEKDKNHVEI